jgi:hypothetical protein
LGRFRFVGLRAPRISAKQFEEIALQYDVLAESVEQKRQAAPGQSALGQLTASILQMVAQIAVELNQGASAHLRA